MDESVKRLEIDGEIWWEYHGKRYPDICNHGNACAAITDIAEKYCDGVGLDIGAGAYPFGSAFPIRDSVNFFYRNGKQIRRQVPNLNGVNAYNLGCFVDNSLDYIFSSHCLEHLEKPQTALNLWVTKIKLGGILFLYLPHPSMELWRMGAPWVRGAHKWIPEPEMIARMINKIGLEIITEQYGPDNFFSFYFVGMKNG